MKKSLKHIIILLFFSVLSNPLFSSTVKWLVKPNYDRIEVYCDHVYKCYLDGKMQLISSAGDRLLPILCDSVTDFTDGYALVLEKGPDNTKWLIRGFFNEENLKYKEIPHGYYTMKYSYFSEGLLAVGNAENKYGYLNTQGLEVIACQYYKARPFIQGWASVQIDNNPSPYKNHVIYINKMALPMKVHFHHGEVNDATSFNEKGEAVVIHYKSGDMAVINTQGEKVKQYNKPDDLERFYRHYDRAFNENGMDFNPPGNKMPQYDASISITLKENLYGYCSNNNTILPEQFAYAGPFADRCAIVSTGGRFGILTMIDGDVTSSIKEGRNIVFEAGKKNPKLTYLLEIPSEIPSVQVKIDPGDGIMTPVEETIDGYVFTPKYKKDAKKCIICAEVWSDGILLLKDTFIQGIQSVTRITITPPVVTSERANHKDIQTIKSSITNNSATPLQLSVVFTIQFSSNSSNSLLDSITEYNLSPGETKDFFASISVKESESIKVTVSASTNNKKTVSSTSTVKLLPYF